MNIGVQRGGRQSSNMSQQRFFNVGRENCLPKNCQQAETCDALVESQSTRCIMRLSTRGSRSGNTLSQKFFKLKFPSLCLLRPPTTKASNLTLHHLNNVSDTTILVCLTYNPGTLQLLLGSCQSPPFRPKIFGSSQRNCSTYTSNISRIVPSPVSSSASDQRLN